jgi:hypothetical protein
MKHKITGRYVVKSSTQPYARILGSHCTLHEAYKTLVKCHRAHYKNHRFILAQDVIQIIATELPKETILADIKRWADQDVGPRSKQRLPLPIVVHQWNPDFTTYLRFGEKND